MPIITLKSRNGTKTQVTIDPKNLSSIKEAIKDAPDTTVVIFADVNQENDLVSTDWIVIKNSNKDAKLKEEYQQYSHILGKGFVIFPMPKTVFKPQGEKLNKWRELVAERIFDNYSPPKKGINFEIHNYPLQEAEFHQGIDFVIDEQQEHDPPIVLEEPLVESDKTFNNTDWNWETNNNISFGDETLRLADDLIKANGGKVITAENSIYLYFQKIGIWEQYNDKKMIKYLYTLTYFKLNAKASKEVLHVLKAIKQLTYHNTFPVFSEEGDNVGDNVLVFNNTALIPAKKKALPFSANHYVRNPNHYDYNPQAECQKWLKFLDKTFKDDKDAEQKIQFLQEFIGLSLTNNVKYQQSLMLYGAGSNGKSVILQVVVLLVGEGNVSHLSLKNFNNKFGLAKLNGKLVNIDADIEYDAMKAEGKFKSVVAGDEITAEEKYEPSFSFKPVAKLWIAANVLPKVRNNSHGYYRRFIILEFNNIVPKEEQDKNLINELKEELSGILNWALEGLERLMKNDALTIPDSSQEAIKNYECENNHTKQFVEEYLEITDKHSRTKKEDIYKRFCDVLAANNYPKIDAGRFGRELKALGVEDSKSGSSRFYHVKFKNIPANDSEMETKQAA